MHQSVTNGKSTLVPVMAWCLQVTSHYLSQCWPRFTLPYGVTRPQWVKSDCDVTDQSVTDVTDQSVLFSSIACGTSWHAAGLVSRHKFYANESAITTYSAQLYKDLDASGYNTGMFAKLIKSLPSWGYGWNFECVIFRYILLIAILSVFFFKITLRCMSLNHIYNKSTFV